MEPISKIIPFKKRRDKLQTVYSRCLLTRKIVLSINFVGKTLDDTIENYIKNNFEGKCVVEGYIKRDSSKIIKYSSGIIERGNKIIFDVIFECDICLPVEGMIIPCLVKNVVKAGVRENDASVITNSTKQTKQGMKDMIRLFEEGKGNDVIAMANKTTNPIGRSITNRLQSLKTVRSGLGKRLQSVVDGDLGKTKVDISSSIAPINTMLNEAGIKPILRGNKLVLPKDWHVGTTFGLKNMAGVRKTIEDAYALFDIQTTGGVTDLKSAHGLKKNLDELVDASKLSEAGVTQQTIRKIAEMRKAVNDELSKVPQYGAVNDELGKVIQAMAPFEKFLEPGQKFTDAKVTNIVGNTMKTVSSDSVAAAALRQDLLAVEKYMRDANIAFPDDPAALIQFREALLNNFNISPATTVDYGTGSRLGSAAVSLSLGNTFGAGHDAAQLIRIGMKKRQANKLAKDNKKAFNIIKMSVNQ